MNAKNLEERIESKPDVMPGKPVFRGTRIPVYVVLDLLDAGATPEEIVDDDEILMLADIAAAIAFRDHQTRNVTVRARTAVPKLIDRPAVRARRPRVRLARQRPGRDGMLASTFVTACLWLAGSRRTSAPA